MPTASSMLSAQSRARADAVWPPKWTDPPPPSSLDPREGARQQEVLRRIWAEYLASHDGISAAQIAGLEPLPKESVESRLDQLGETWRRSEYWL